MITEIPKGRSLRLLLLEIKEANGHVCIRSRLKGSILAVGMVTEVGEDFVTITNPHDSYIVTLNDVVIKYSGKRLQLERQTRCRDYDRR